MDLYLWQYLKSDRTIHMSSNLNDQYRNVMMRHQDTTMIEDDDEEMSTNTDSESEVSNITIDAAAFQDLAPKKTQCLREALKTDIIYNNNTRSNIAFYINTLVFFDLVLPSIQDLNRDIWSFCRNIIIDVQTEQAMVNAKSLNWCTAVKELTPIRTKGR